MSWYDESVPDRTFAAKVVKIDRATEDISWSYQVYDDPTQNHQYPLVYWSGDSVLVYMGAWWQAPQAPLYKLTTDGVLQKTVYGNLLGIPLFSNGYMFSASGGFTLVSCIRLDDLSVVWKAGDEQVASCNGQPALYKGVLYTPSQDAIYCYDAATGRFLGKDEEHWCSAFMNSSLSNTITYGDLFIVTNGETVFAVHMNAEKYR